MNNNQKQAVLIGIGEKLEPRKMEEYIENVRKMGTLAEQIIVYTNEIINNRGNKPLVCPEDMDKIGVIYLDLLGPISKAKSIVKQEIEKWPKDRKI